MYNNSTVLSGIQIYRLTSLIKNARVLGKMVANNSFTVLKVLVTGGAEFIGDFVVDRLVEMGNMVVFFDNVSSGRMEFIEHHLKHN